MANAASGANARPDAVRRERLGALSGHTVRGLDEEPDEAGLPDVVLLWDGRPVLRTGVRPKPTEQCGVRGGCEWHRRGAGLLGRDPAGEGHLEPRYPNGTRGHLYSRRLGRSGGALLR